MICKNYGVGKNIVLSLFLHFRFFSVFSENFDGNFLKSVIKVGKTGKKDKNIKNIKSSDL